MHAIVSCDGQGTGLDQDGQDMDRLGTAFRPPTDNRAALGGARTHAPVGANGGSSNPPTSPRSVYERAGFHEGGHRKCAPRPVHVPSKARSALLMS